MTFDIQIMNFSPTYAGINVWHLNVEIHLKGGLMDSNIEYPSEKWLDCCVTYEF